MIKIPIEIGDTVLMGKFKNKRVVVKDFGIDDHGLPTINGKPILKIRIPKIDPTMHKKETKIKLIDLIEQVYFGDQFFKLNKIYGSKKQILDIDGKAITSINIYKNIRDISITSNQGNKKYLITFDVYHPSNLKSKIGTLTFNKEKFIALMNKNAFELV